jgi:transcription elongation factor S-II
MRKIDNIQEFRKNIVVKLNKFISDEESCNNLEKGIFNYTLDHATKLNVVKKWDNSYFVRIYLDRTRTIYINLKNKEILDKINSKELKAHKLAFMTHQEMQPDKWNALIQEKKIRDDNKYEPKIEASTDDFTCWKCKSKKCTYYQLQTRSADEPMTTFVSCLDCGNRWKC